MQPTIRRIAKALVFLGSLLRAAGGSGNDIRVIDTEDELRIETPELGAAVSKRGYVTGIKRQSFVDRRTGFRDAGFGLDIVDWIMEPGSDETYRNRLEGDLVYRFGNEYHGARPKRAIEGPQICTKARVMEPHVVRGKDFVAVRQQFKYRTAAPGHRTGSLWTQWIVFPKGKRYFISMDQIDAVNDSDAMFLRIDLPGHIKHSNGDSFEKIFLSYHGEIESGQFIENFAPDVRFNFRRDRNGIPDRMIRAYKLRDPASGQSGPWLAGMTLDPAMVHEAWCHQRGYVCMIEEIGGYPVKSGESFSAAFIIGFFDSRTEMEATYDQYRGMNRLEVTPDGWKLSRRERPSDHNDR